MPPPGIDMSAIQAALARRAQGAPAPATDQMTAPGGALPTGGPNTPVQNASPMPMPNMPPHSLGMHPGASPQPSQAMGVAKAAGAANSPAFDDSTRLTAKALIAKLLQVM